MEEADQEVRPGTIPHGYEVWSKLNHKHSYNYFDDGLLEVFTGWYDKIRFRISETAAKNEGFHHEALILLP